MNERVPLALLLPLRLLVAFMLLVEGYQKFREGWLHGDVFARVTQTWLDSHRSYHLFLPLLNTAHAHPKIFATLVTLGELTVGASLLLGLVTRAASFVGLMLLVAIAGTSGQGLAPPGNAVLMAAILFTFVLTPPGRVLGLDQRLRLRLPRWLV